MAWSCSSPPPPPPLRQGFRYMAVGKSQEFWLVRLGPRGQLSRFSVPGMTMGLMDGASMGVGLGIVGFRASGYLGCRV
ncbi:hypothetical protein V6N13_004605 [Hibiscus sabdariffa]